MQLYPHLQVEDASKPLCEIDATLELVPLVPVKGLTGEQQLAKDCIGKIAAISGADSSLIKPPSP